MRRAVVVGVLAGTLYLAACSDRPTEPPSSPDAGLPAPQVVTPTCSITLNQLIDLAAKLFPAGAQRNAVVTALKALPPRAQDRLSLAIRKAAFSIIDIATKAYTAGKLNPQATPADLLAFIQGMYCFVGLTPPTIPQPIDKNEFATAVITSNSGPTTVEPPSKHGGLQFQGTTLPAGVPAVTIFVTKLPDTPGPLFTSLDQFPQFYEFSAFPEVTFTKNVLAGVCQAQNLAESSSLLLAHNVLPKFGAGAVEVLPHVDPTFLNCLDIVGNVGLLGGVREFFASALLPTQLHASTSLMTTVGTGGNLKHLSPFGSVNPGSNPGSIGTVDANGQPTDGSVSGADSVYVKATSKNGTPIQKLPVAFGQDTVLTKESGIAAFKWDATPGTTLTATVLNEPGCPGTNPGTAYLPKVCFSPNSVTFTALSSVQLSVQSGDAQTGFANQILTAPLVVSATQNGEPVQGLTVNFSVTSGGGSITASATTNEQGNAEATWTLGPSIGNQTVSAGAAGATSVSFSATATTPPSVRAVLQWGSTPSDLDFHLTGPGDGDRFHVYYASRGSLSGSPFASLDRDDVDSFGPETITISTVNEGVYRFSVHNYANRFDNPSNALAQSGATVTVYLSSGTTQVFNVPNSGGTLWTVFELSGTTITPKNVMSYTSDPGNGAVFSILGRASSALSEDQAIIQADIESHRK